MFSYLFSNSYQYNGVDASIDAYSKAVLQFGYITLFITALPISCLAALLCLAVHIRTKAWLLVNMFQRPCPEGAQDIGYWFV